MQMLRSIWGNMFADRWYSCFKSGPKFYVNTAIGCLLCKIMPGKAKLIKERYYLSDGPYGFIDTCIRAAACREFRNASEQEIKKETREFWVREYGEEWHEKKFERFEGSCNSGEFIATRKPLEDQINSLVHTNPDKFQSICEIGTGHGLFLKRLSEEVDLPGYFVGLDLSEGQIRTNQERYKDSRLIFLNEDVTGWIDRQGKPGCIFVTFGVFTCFTQRELEDLLAHVKAKMHPAAFAIVETTKCDLANQPDSSLMNGKRVFAHNYPHLFARAGYAVFEKKIELVNPDVRNYYNVTMLATTG